jgi:hypothetical protein
MVKTLRTALQVTRRTYGQSKLSDVERVHRAIKLFNVIIPNTNDLGTRSPEMSELFDAICIVYKPGRHVKKTYSYPSLRRTRSAPGAVLRGRFQ